MTFASGDTSKTISFTPTDDDIDDDDEKIKLAFGTFPPGVSAGSTSSTKVSIDDDDDDPEVKVEFGAATYSLTEPNSVTVKTAHGVSPRSVEEPPPVNSPPAFPSTENGRREVAEDASGGDDIGDPVVATDLNVGDAAVNDPLMYSLTGTDAGSFTIDASSGQLALAQNVDLDYEGKRSYRVTVEVTDGRDRNGDDDNDVIDDTINVSINVTDLNEAPTVSGDATATYTENGSRAIATYTGRDPERNKLTWSVSGTDGNDFVMTTQGRLHFASPPSFEGGKDTYEVTVVATDEGDLTGTFDVTDVEEEGAVTITPPRGWTGTQFSAGLTDGDGSLVDQTWQWARSTNRSSWTDISGETSSAYTATADDVGNYLRISTEYTDNRGSGKTAEAVLTARIADAADRPTTNETPEFADTTDTRSISQGTALGRSIGAAVRARDADRDDVLIYSLSGSDADSFDIDPRTGQLQTKSVLLHDPQGQNTYTVTVEVHDGFDQQYAPSPALDDSIDVTITVTARRTPSPSPPSPSGNSAPAFTEGDSATRSVSEDTAAGVNIGDPVTATDPDGDPLTYSLSGTDAEFFTIDVSSGQLRSNSPLDYEAQAAYSITVSVRDSRDFNGEPDAAVDAAVTVTIRVTNVELPGKGNDYDADRNETIDRDEAIAAVTAYFEDTITLGEAMGIVVLYLQSPAPSTGGQTGHSAERAFASPRVAGCR